MAQASESISLSSKPTTFSDSYRQDAGRVAKQLPQGGGQRGGAPVLSQWQATEAEAGKEKISAGQSLPGVNVLLD